MYQGFTANNKVQWNLMLEKCLFSAPLSYWTLRFGETKNLSFLPQPLQKGNAEKGKLFIQGYFTFANQTVEFLSTSPFAAQAPSKQWLTSLHNFDWLSDLMAVEEQNAPAYATSLVLEWVNKFSKYNSELWSVDILSKRILNWLFYYQKIMSLLEGDRHKKLFLICLLKQCIFLRKRLKYARKRTDYILILIRSIIASMCNPDERLHIKKSLKILADELKNSFYKDGGHYSRNISLQAEIIKELLIFKELLIRSGTALMPDIDQVLIHAVQFITFMRHADGKFAVFNGSFEQNESEINMLLGRLQKVSNYDAYKAEESGYYHLRAETTHVIADFGLQQSSKYAQSSHAGRFAFEFSDDKERIFVNCGSGSKLDSDWEKALKVTDAQTTLSLDNLPNYPIKLEEHFDINIKPKNPPLTVITHQGFLLEGQHEGYALSHGILHRRRLLLHKNGQVLQGEDWLFSAANAGYKLRKSKQTNDYPFHIRFHIHPDTTAKLSSQRSVYLQTLSGQSWMFTTTAAKLILEPSIYTGADGLPRETQQVVLNGNTVKREAKVRWTLQKVEKAQV